MDKENGETSETTTGSSSKDTSNTSGVPASAASLLDPANLFGAYWPQADSRASNAASLFAAAAAASAGANAYGAGSHPALASHHAAAAAAAAAGLPFGLLPPAAAAAAAAASGGRGSASSAAYTNTLSVAASQAASLGINPAASAAWWSMASQLAAQDYLARLQASGLSFPSLGGPGDPYSALGLSSLGSLSHKSSKSSSSKNGNSSSMSSMNSSSKSSSNKNRTSATALSIQAGAKLDGRLDPTSNKSSSSSSSRDLSAAYLQQSRHSTHKLPTKTPTGLTIQPTSKSSSSGQKRPLSPPSGKPSPDLLSSKDYSKAQQIPLPKTSSMPKSSTPHLNTSSSTSIFTSPLSLATSVNSERDTPERSASSTPGSGGSNSTGQSTTTTAVNSSVTTSLPSNILSAALEGSDPSSILGGVRLPPDTEIIKYTSSIVGPKIPGTTNRGRKKTISLDPPSVSVLPTHSSTGMLLERNKWTKLTGEDPQDFSKTNDRVEVIKLPATNGSPSGLNLTLSTNNSETSSGGDAPLNLSLKPTTSTTNCNNNSLNSLSNLSASIGADRISRRKPGPKPRRIIQSPSQLLSSGSIPGAPSPSLAQLFAAADSPRPPSRNEDDYSNTQSSSMPQPSSHLSQNHKDGRPRNLGRGVSKPKKNTVASLLAQSRALGIKPVQLDPNTPMNQQMSLLKSNILAAQQYISEHATSSEDLKQLEKIRNALSDSSNMEVSTDSDNLTDSNQTDSEPDTDANGLSNPKKRRHYNERELRMPLDQGWKRETVIRGMSKSGRIIGDVYYTPPDSNTKFKQWTEVALYLEQTGKSLEFTRDNFTFSSKIILGDYLQKPPPGATSEGEYLRLKEDELNRSDSGSSNHIEHQNFRLEDLQSLTRSSMSNLAVEQRIELARKQQAARAAARLDREQARIAREIERNEKQEAARRDREARTQQLMEGRKRLAFTLEQKMQIINEIEGGKTKSDVSRQMGLASSTVATIWKNRENILNAYGSSGQINNHSENSIDDPLAKLKECLPPETIIASPMAKRKRHEDLARQKQEEQQRKIQERELKKQQQAMIKEQMYIQEINKQREMLYTVELERERRRQHMSLVKALEARRKLEERERKKQQALLEKQASKERRMEQRKIDMELLQEIRKPCEDLELMHKPMPEFDRIEHLKLSGQAFSDVLMVFEFLHNFGETLGFDMESLPTLLSLQQALLNESTEAEEELLSVMTHLLVCAIEDPGIPNPARHTTILGQSLRQADITHQNISEVLRIYLYANATGEVKTLAGVHFERDRDRRIADHHQTDQEMLTTQSGKNAIYYEMLHENPTWRMSDSLKDKPFLGLNPTEKAAILAFLVNELLQNKAVIRQIESSMDNVAHLRKERWLLDNKIRKVKMTYNRRIRMEAAEKLHAQVKLDNSENNSEMETSALGVDSPALQHKDDLLEDMDEISENESEGTQPEEEEDKKLTCEEIGKKLEKLIKTNETSLEQLNAANHQIRATCFGQDRYWRRYWSLPKAGGIFVEAMESAAPEILAEQEKITENNVLGINSVEDIKRIIHDTETINDLNVDKEVSNIVGKLEEENEHRKTPNRSTSMETENPSDLIENSSEKEKSESPEAIKTETTEEDQQTIKEEVSIPEDDKKLVLESTKNLFQNLGETMEKENSKNIEIKTEMDMKMETNEDEIKMEVKEEIKKEDGDEKDEKPAIDPNKKWFSILMKDGTTCDGTNLTSGNRWDTGIICTRENFAAELKIPVFPPPNCSNNYIYPTCDSPGPLQMTQEESVQLEHIKTHGLPKSGDTTIVPPEFRYGWWRITEPEKMKEVLESLHMRGARERELKRYFQASMQNMYESSAKVQVEEGDKAATSLETPPDQEPEMIANVEMHYGAPIMDTPGSLNSVVAERVDYLVLEQVEALEDKVANASMQIKGWRVPNRENEDVSPGSAMTVAKERLAALEGAIERRYLKPPLGVRNVLVIDSHSDQNQNTQPPHQEDLNQSTLSDDGYQQNNGTSGSATPQQNSSDKEKDKDKDKDNHDSIPKGLNVWREALQRSNTSAQVAMCLYMLEASIAWDKSIMKAVRESPLACQLLNRQLKRARYEHISNCQFCHSGDNEDKLLLCDGCDKGYHTYCFRPKMDTIPEGNWYCYECINKATGDRNCIVCGKKQSSSGRLLQCEACPRAFHQDCLNPPMLKAPRGKWYCSNCHGKAPHKKKARRSYNKQCRDSESSDHQPASPAPSHSSVTTNEDLTNQSTVSTPCKSSTINEQPMSNSNCGAGTQSTSSSPAGGSVSSATPVPKKDRTNKKLQKELAPCKILLEDLECHDDAWPFLLPVNTKQFPTYKKIINNPMDLSTIRKRLQDLQYKSREEFCMDVRQIFDNCETFNEDDSPVGKAGHCMRQFFEARWSKLCALHIGKS